MEAPPSVPSSLPHRILMRRRRSLRMALSLLLTACFCVWLARKEKISIREGARGQMAAGVKLKSVWHAFVVMSDKWLQLCKTRMKS